jgi:CubicO group peptidase (beta-lactamase class C family)
MEKDAIFRIASMTKAVTSVAAMMLYEEGGFLLDDPVSGLIPEFKNPRILVKTRARDSSFTSRPAKREITVRHLLNQTSGIGYGNSHPDLKPLYDKARIPDGIVTTDAVLGDKMKALAKLPLLHEPGEKWTYGLNTDVLGYLIETISGKTLQDFFQERIFTPLGMTDTYFFIPEDKADRLVPLYEEPETGVIRKSSVTAFNYPVEGGKNYYSGGGGLCSTARDYAKFLQALLNGGEYNGARLLGRKTLDLMTLNQADGYWEKNTFGLGFGMTDQRGVSEKPCSVGNYWWSGYFGTSFWVDPEEELVGVLMLQVSPARHGEIHQKFEVLTYQSIID